jgi:N-acetyl-gamma-glutamylphosphate reductase
MNDTRKLKVFLVGVGGKTGGMLMERLGNHPEFSVKGSDAEQPELLRQLMQGSDRLVM